MAKIRVKQLKGNTEYTKLYGEEWVQLNQDNNGNWFCNIDTDKMQKDFENNLVKLQGVIDIIDLYIEYYDAFFKDAANSDHEGTMYTIIGDITDAKYIENTEKDVQSYGKYFMAYGNMPSDEYKNRSLTIIDKQTSKEEAKQLKGKSVKITGKRGKDRQTLVVTEKIAPEDIRDKWEIYKKIEEIKKRKYCEEKSELIEEKIIYTKGIEIEKKKCLNVAVIANKEHEGYIDFMDVIDEYGDGKILVANYSVDKLDAQAVADRIQEINNDVGENKVDVICIVRGGSDKITTHCNFSLNMELINAIIGSGIPICTGIGHVSDKTVCDELADIDGKVPYGAAIAMVNIVRGWNDKKKECEYEGTKNRNRELTEENENLKQENAKIKAAIENQQNELNAGRKSNLNIYIMVALLVLVGLCGFYFINTGSKNSESTSQAVTVQQLQELANSNQRPKKGLVWITKTTRIEGRSLFVEGSFVNNHEMTATGIKDAAFEIVLLDGQGKTIGKRTAEIDGIRFERKVSTGNAYETTLELPDILKESDGKVISTVIIPKEINWSAIKPQ